MAEEWGRIWVPWSGSFHKKMEDGCFSALVPPCASCRVLCSCDPRGCPVRHPDVPLALGKCNGVNGIFASLSLVVWGLDSVVSSKPKSGIWRGWQDRAADLSGQLHSLLRSAVVALGVRVGASVVPKLPRERG